MRGTDDYLECTVFYCFKLNLCKIFISYFEQIFSHFFFKYHTLKHIFDFCVVNFLKKSRYSV